MSYSFDQSRCQSRAEMMVAKTIVSGTKLLASLWVSVKPGQKGLSKCLVAPLPGKPSDRDTASPRVIIANAQGPSDFSL